jgi:hypothetical protein
MISCLFPVGIEVNERADGLVLACHVHAEKKTLRFDHASGYGLLRSHVPYTAFNYQQVRYNSIYTGHVPVKQTSGGDASRFTCFFQADAARRAVPRKQSRARAPAPCVRTCGFLLRSFTITSLRVRGGGCRPALCVCRRITTSVDFVHPA